ncbi:hypothetical protein GUJ93_ZPchr0005g15656 [Zizania palustris]|uniref:HMA domain-containing protein n=1 Tax=Zizania palustris TaxID=103762 RepID=A0A8J5T337_ZIZPA|nr:hypothetical protein GUJ93_ZPchr0005g15656 [Zizania palustris]
MAVAEEGPEPLKYQTLALKVSIHCEGCKKKVKKVLHSIEGVYKTDIDVQHQKVVVIGNVSVDTLVKKLAKTGKHAEPWPEPAPPPAAANSPGGGGKKKKKNKNKNPANSKPVEPAPPAAAPAEGGGGGPVPPENHDHVGSCDEASDDDTDQQEGGGGGVGSPKKLGAGDAQAGGPGAMAPFAMTPHGKQPIAPPTNGNGSGGGGGKKKKGKKGGSGNGSGGNANAIGDGAGAIVDVSPQDPPTKPGTLAVVDGGVYPAATPLSYPGSYYAAGGGHMLPYVMSYNTAHPLRSSAYYHPMVGAAYTGSGSGSGSYFYSTAPASSAAPGSYYMFSEENANACSVM